MKLSLFPIKSIGIGKVSVIFSTAKMGAPAVIFPITGTSTNSFPLYIGLSSIFCCPSSPPFNSFNVLPFCSSFLIYPFVCNPVIYVCTVAVELNPTAFPISLTEGGYPFSLIDFSMYFNIAFYLLFSSFGSFLIIYNHIHF